MEASCSVVALSVSIFSGPAFFQHNGREERLKAHVSHCMLHEFQRVCELVYKKLLSVIGVVVHSQPRSAVTDAVTAVNVRAKTIIFRFLQSSPGSVDAIVVSFHCCCISCALLLRPSLQGLCVECRREFLVLFQGPIGCAVGVVVGLYSMHYGGSDCLLFLFLAIHLVV